MKNNSKRKRVATPEEVVELARKIQWRDVQLPSGNMVPAETSRQIFADAEAVVKSQSRRKRAHAAFA